MQGNGRGDSTSDHCAYPNVGLVYVCGMAGRTVKYVSVFETGHYSSCCLNVSGFLEGTEDRMATSSFNSAKADKVWVCGNPGAASLA